MSGLAKNFVFVDERFGELVVIDPDGPRLNVTPSFPSGVRSAVCLCDCGNVISIRLSDLRAGHTTRCDLHRLRSTILRTHPLYGTWHAMIFRCHRSQDPGYENYGGRGIQVYEPWHDARTFVEWIGANLGPRPDGMTLDRIDNDGNYEPGNVRWADWSTQVRNQRPRSRRSS
jgi:hypothetical protein